MPHFIFFYLILFGSCAFALWRGDRDGRIVALICLLASLISPLVLRPVINRYSGVEIGVFTIDLLTFAGFTLVALASKRFWPLWVAALQLTTLLSHLMREVDSTLVARAYAVAAVFWSYPILLILAVGTWRGHRRESQANRDWQAVS